MSEPQEITDQTVVTSLVGTDYITGIDRSDTTQGADGSMCLITRDNLGLGLSIAATQLTGSIADARVPESNITQHEAALSIAATQLTGSIADARVPESNITQHEAALSITESQISDLGSYAPLAGATFSGAVVLPSNGLSVGTTQLVVSGGNIGIGKSSPGAVVDITGTGSGGRGLRIVESSSSKSTGVYTLEVDSSAQGSNMTAAGALMVEVSSGVAMVVNGSGNTGFGTSAPTETVDIDGTLRVRSLPTSDPAQAGEFWNDSGTVKVSAG